MCPSYGTVVKPPTLFSIYLFTQRKKYINLIKQINFVFISEAKVCFDNFLLEIKIQIQKSSKKAKKIRGALSSIQ